MVDNYDLYCTKKNKYMRFCDSELSKNFVKGKFLDTNNDYGFVEISSEEEDIFVHGSNANNAIDGDIVLVEITKGKRNEKKCEGRIVKVISHEVKIKEGEVYHYENKIMVSLDDKKIKKLVVLEGEGSLIERLVDGDKVQVEFINNRNDNKYLYAKFVKRIGHINDPDIDILSIIADNGFDVDFPEEVLLELKDIPTEVSEKEMKNRRDLSGEVIFTIDGDDTKDIDDAISVKVLKNGNFKLGVHIADVSYYVKENSALDLEARNRGTSVYLTDRVVPMLPHQLSNGICSLNPNVLRLATSCVMEIDENGNVVDYDIFESVIKSRIQMTYKKVNSILEDNVVPEGYEEYEEKLRLMAELAEVLRKFKVRRGYIDFGVQEAKILVDEECKPTDVVIRERGVGENLIEDFMIAANECVASHIFYMSLPFVYRIHEIPEEERIRSFLAFVSSLGYSVAGDIKDVKPTTMQGILKSLEDKPEFKILSSLLLRSMKKAVYRPENLGHYGLASPCYTHFTSPIRRYPDTTVHRLLRTYLFQGKVDMGTIKKWEEKLVYITEHSSDRERAAVECEREVEDMKMAEYMEEHIGEEFEGMVSSVTNFGMFVELDNLIEGLVPLREMNDFFHYDEERMTLTGERTNIKYSIGDRLLVKVVRASREEKTIDFEVVKKV